MLWLVLFGQVGMLSAVGENCDPSVDKLWHPVQDDSTKFYYCHPTKRTYQLDSCRAESGQFKQFNFTLQQCVPVPDSHNFGVMPSLTPSSHRPVYQRPDNNRADPPGLTACPRGRQAMRKPGSSRLVECSAVPDLDDPSLAHCGKDGLFRCSFSSRTGDRGTCCEALKPNQVKCPPKMKALLQKDGMVRACSPRKVGTCPADSVCVFDEEQGDFHCCQPDDYEEDLADPDTSTMTYLAIGVGGQRRPPLGTKPRKYASKGLEDLSGCPQGDAPFVPHFGRDPMQCSTDPSKGSSCPPGYKCYFSRRHQRFQCCGLASGYCPSNSAALVGPKSRKVSCGTLSGCPDGFFCYMATHTCCSMDPGQAICDHGSPYTSVDGKARGCDQGPCPGGYSCTHRFGRSICCPEPDACPFGNPLSSSSGRILTCSEVTPCPSRDYSCYESNRGSFCCPKADIMEFCPVGVSVEILNDKPVQCKSDDDCAPHFDCTMDKENTGYCCATSAATTATPSTQMKQRPTSATARCSDGQAPLRTPDKEVQVCVPHMDAQCPIGYECELDSYLGRMQCCPRPRRPPTNLVIDDCPGGFVMQVDRRSGGFVTCEPELKSCPTFARCHHSQANDAHVCCEPNSLEGLLKIERDSTDSAVWSGIVPGAHGCLTDGQCQVVLDGTRCEDGICKCPPALSAYDGACVANCPAGFQLVDGLCSRSPS